MLDTKQNVKMFETLDDLVDDLTRQASPNVKLHNVENLFANFGALLLFVLFVFNTNRLRFAERRQRLASLLALTTAFARDLVR